MESRTAALMAFSLGVLLAVAGTANAQSDPNPAADDWLDVRYDLQIQPSLETVTLDGTVDMHQVKVPEQEGQQSDDRLRQFCNGSCSADELRQAYQRSDQQGKQQLVSSIESVVADAAEATLDRIAGSNGNAQATADASEASLRQSTDGSTYQPPVPVNVTGQATIGLLADAGYTDDQIDALFEMGARTSIPIDETVEPGWNLTVTLSVPEPLSVIDAARGDISPDEKTVTNTVTNWKGATAKTLSDEMLVGRADVVVPNRQKANLDITLDLQSVDVSFTGLLGGGAPANAHVRMQVQGTFTSIENPRELDRVKLPYLSADAVRIAREHNLVGTNQLTQLGDQARTSMKEAFKSNFGKDVKPTGGFSAETLSSSAVGSPPGTGPPIRLDVQAEADVDFPPSQETGGTAAASGFTVTTVDAGSFSLPDLDLPVDVPTNITLVLPDGLELKYDRVENGNISAHQTDDGRNAYTITPTGNGQVSIQNSQIDVGSGFVWDVFWPLILFLFLVLVVLPAVLIFVVARRRREDEGGGGGSGENPVAGGRAGEAPDAGSTATSNNG